MKYYFVSKTPTSGFIGQLTLEEILARLKAGDISGDYMVTESTGPSYAQTIKRIDIPWMPVSELAAGALPAPVKTSLASKKPTRLIYSMNGFSGSLEVFEDRVVITRKGSIKETTKTIPLFSITAIEFKKSWFAPSMLKFTVPGGDRQVRGLSVGGFGSVTSGEDPNEFSFGGSDELALEIKCYIEQRIQDLHKAQVASPNPSISGEIEKLAEMHAKGFLSDEEFQAAKRRLIG